MHRNQGQINRAITPIADIDWWKSHGPSLQAFCVFHGFLFSNTVYIHMMAIFPRRQAQSGKQKRCNNIILLCSRQSDKKGLVSSLPNWSATVKTVDSENPEGHEAKSQGNSELKNKRVGTNGLSTGQSWWELQNSRTGGVKDVNNGTNEIQEWQKGTSGSEEPWDGTRWAKAQNSRNQMNWGTQNYRTRERNQST